MNRELGTFFLNSEDVGIAKIDHFRSHPEKPGRLEAVLSGFQENGLFERCRILDVRNLIILHYVTLMASSK